MALQKEIWIADIQENLFPANTFMAQVGQDHSGFVSYKTVHIPQAGANPTVKKDRNSYPATIGQRGDAEVTYQLHEYTTDPIHIADIDELQISYNKRQSVLSQHMLKLQSTVANNTLYSWAIPDNTANRVVLTSGSTSGTALAPGASGTRKNIVLNDIKAALQILDTDNVDPNDGRSIILPAALYWQLMTDSNITKYLEFGQAVNITGKIPMLLGCKIFVRSSVIVYDNSQVIKTVGDDGTPTATATTDNLGAFVVSDSYLSKAVGEIKVYYRVDDPAYYGSYFSAKVMQGATILRTNREGIVTISQN